MTIPAHTLGMAILCSVDGIIQHVLHDDVGVAGRVGAGQPFSLLLDRGSIGKSVDFLMAIRAHGIAIGWELNIGRELLPLSMHFTGGLMHDQLLIVGARTHTDILSLYEDLLRLNNEQVNRLRAALKTQYDQVRQAAQQDSALYDEVTRLNNDLMVAQRALAKANAELERLNALKNQFLGMAAHDLRSPLGVILTYSEFLIDEATPALTGEQQEFLAVIHTSTDFMLKLVNDLLDVAIIESGQLHLDLEPTDLVALLRHTVGVHRVLGAKKGLTITLIENPVPVLLLDAAKIEQVINNLLGNAIKFSPPDTTITVHTLQYPTEIGVRVQDQGPGIPEHEREKLFHLFQRTSVRSTAGEKSTGLGLAIARRIIQGHGGRIEVDSQVGQGTAFTLRLPHSPLAGAPVEND
jgi:signal transduction histidine kinase